MSDETFIPSSDRPVSINLDSPLSELRVRDLAVLLERLGRPQKIHPKFEGHSP